MLKNGHQVRHIALSTATESIPDGFNSNATKKEFVKAQEIFGIDDYHIYEYPVRRFPTHRQDILETLVKEKKKYKPNIIISTSDSDLHQDHAQLGSETLRAFYELTVIQYICRKSINDISPNFFLELTDEEVELKHKLISAYESQLSKHDYIEMAFNIMNSRKDIQGTRNPLEAFNIWRYMIKANERS